MQSEFVLRGHHLLYLTDLMPPISYSPTALAASDRQFRVERRGDMTAAAVDWQVLINPSDTPKFHATYAYDLVGETNEQADAYEDNIRNVFLAFTALKNEAVVALTATGAMDDICKTCTFGRHCQIPPQGGVDAQYLDIFEDALHFARTKDKTLFASAFRPAPDNIRTSALAVRRVMMLFALGGHDKVSELYNDALRRQRIHGSMFAGPGFSALEEVYNRFSQTSVNP